MKNSNHTTSARPEDGVAVEHSQDKDAAEGLEQLSSDEQQFIHQCEQEQQEILARLAPHELEEMVGKAVFDRIAHLLYLECDHPFGMDGKLTRQGREVALRLMHSAVDDLSKNMDLWLTYRVVDLKMHMEEIPFA